ncbi:hypothetical protein Y046_6160 [Burkholderia pseudomallei MSHR2990]|nr:hypothetical protein Y046_6160 [Burkholderia pseudomallei MSHR2990]KGX99344.1 hypothetical protein X997_4101 [Burkholderia pseudomallei A79C]
MHQIPKRVVRVLRAMAECIRPHREKATPVVVEPRHRATWPCVRYELAILIVCVANAGLRWRRLHEQVTSFVPRVAPLPASGHRHAHRLVAGVVLGA